MDSSRVFQNHKPIMKKVILVLAFGIGLCFTFKKSSIVKATINHNNIEYYTDVMQEIKRREGLRLEKYICPAGVETIGYGQTGAIPDSIKLMEAINMLHETFETHYQQAQKEFKGLQRNQYLAIAMLTYNIGWSRLRSYKLYNKIKENKAVWSDWYQIRFYKSNGKYIESENLKKARLFELAIFKGKLN